MGQLVWSAKVTHVPSIAHFEGVFTSNEFPHFIRVDRAGASPQRGPAASPAGASA